jgi:mercuric ion transport protein
MLRHILDFGKNSEIGHDSIAIRNGSHGARHDVPAASEQSDAGRQRLAVLGGILGALAASSCCIIPLVLFTLGIGGAWIGI